MKRRSLLRRRVLRSHGNDGGELVDRVREAEVVAACIINHTLRFDLDDA